MHTPSSKTALTGLWSLIRRLGWLWYDSCRMLSPVHRIRSHHAGVRRLKLKHKHAAFSSMLLQIRGLIYKTS